MSKNLIKTRLHTMTISLRKGLIHSSHLIISSEQFDIVLGFENLSVISFMKGIFKVKVFM